MCCSGAGGCSDSSGRLAAMASVTHASSHTPNASARYLHYPEQRFSCFHSPLTCVSELPTHLLRVKRATSWCALAYHCGVVLARLLSFCTRIVGFTVCGWPSSWALSLQAAPDPATSSSSSSRPAAPSTASAVPAPTATPWLLLNDWLALRRTALGWTCGQCRLLVSAPTDLSFILLDKSEGYFARAACRDTSGNRFAVACPSCKLGWAVWRHRSKGDPDPARWFIRG